MIVQEDRNLVMSGAAFVDLDCAVDLDSAFKAIAAHRPLPLGRYLLRGPRTGQRYLQYQAVVHDLELMPTSRPGDVSRSLTAVLEDAARRGLCSVASEPLGVWEGSGLGFPAMVEAFDAAIMDVSLRVQTPQRLTLLLDNLEQLEEVSHLFRSALLRRASRSFRTVSGDAAVVEVRRAEKRFHCRFVPGSLSGYLVTRVSNVA